MKIDIYLLNRNHGKYAGFTRLKWAYYATTNFAKTCKEAKRRFLVLHPDLSPDQVMCRFQK